VAALAVAALAPEPEPGSMVARKWVVRKVGYKADCKTRGESWQKEVKESLQSEPSMLPHR
jgi:hypothetical protein